MALYVDGKKVVNSLVIDGENSGIPSGNHLDPWQVAGDIPRYNMGMRYSYYEIYDGKLFQSIEFWISGGQGYEGFSVPIPNSYGLVSGKTYKITFKLKFNNARFLNQGYPFGIKHLTTQVSNPATAQTFNVTPTVTFGKNNNEQTIIMNFTAGENNYLFVTLSDTDGSSSGNKISLIQIEEVTE